MGLLDRLREMIAGSAPPEPRPGTFRCLTCGGAHTKEYQTCPDCGGSFVVQDTTEEEASVNEAPWK